LVEIKVVCPECNGNKYILMEPFPQEVTSIYSSKELVEIKCHSCGGKGFIEEELYEK